MFQSKRIPDISANKLFKDTDFNALNLSLSSKDFKNMKEGEIVFETGDKSDALFLIVEGKVKIKMPGKEETSIIILKNKNDFFGEKELIVKSERNSSAVIVESATLYKMKLEQLNKLLSANQEVRKNFSASSLGDEFDQDLTEDFSDISDIDLNNVENYTNEYFDAEQIRSEVEKDYNSTNPENFKDEDLDFSFNENENIEDEFVEDKINLQNENILNENINDSVEEDQSKPDEVNKTQKDKLANQNTNKAKKLETSEEFTEGKMIEENINTGESLNSSTNVLSAKEIIKFISGNIKSSNEIINKYLNVLDKKQLPENVKLILDEVSHQNNLTQNYISALFDFFENKNNLKLNNVSINESLNDILEKLAEYSELRKVELFKKLGDDTSVNLDKDNFYQACYQIIKNSCDASNTDGKIYITSNKNDDEITIEFKDNGIGIPESIKEDIFEPFISHGKEAAGLGLALTKKIINDHGGTIKAESILGEGATIIITLPLPK